MSKVSTFVRYVFPSVLAFALSGVYTIVDGFFIGHSLGDEGLAAINIGYPVAAFIGAVGTGIGLGGAIRFTVRKERGKPGEDAEYFSGTIILLLIASIILTLLLVSLMTPIIRAMGANGYLLLLVREYMLFIALGTGLQILATGLVPFLRNLDGATSAMLAMIAGFLVNVALDYTFILIYGMGMAGAALATIIGQGVTTVAAFFYLFRKKAAFVIPARARLTTIFGSVLKISPAPFGLTISPMITIVIMNRVLLKYGGENAASVFACITYVTAIIYLLLQGIGDGSQPLISACYGKNALTDMKRVVALASVTGVIVAVVCMAGLYLVRDRIGAVFGASPEVSKEVGMILPLFLGSLIFLSLVRVTIAQFYSTEKSGLSYILVFSEPAILFALLMILPRAFGLHGAWVAVPLAQTMTWCISLVAKQKTKLRTTCV